ncbi:hypothetical protein SR870_19185 [Rhodopseudomonas palustris]|uniref:hypothetical protein n=1 Tax=Rhodopseudomonas palustris TaxID=1076 RepID=UPI002ACE1E37|nr:hypothetical protein [Rhodopseudomonas palustris]WQG98791.1 hypothetical protein SR870_19185 [Rhodopseudomonas palustris]
MVDDHRIEFGRHRRAVHVSADRDVEDLAVQAPDRFLLQLGDLRTGAYVTGIAIGQFGVS